jgi:hypothetical protein
MKLKTAPEVVVLHSKLNPKFIGLVNMIQRDTPETQELFNYLLVELFIEAGVAKVVERAVIDARKSLTVELSKRKTITVFEPDKHTDLEDALRDAIIETFGPAKPASRGGKRKSTPKAKSTRGSKRKPTRTPRK